MNMAKIYTLTLNPALDMVVNCPGFSAGTINRYEGEQLFAGGKGVNVAQMLDNLGAPVTALGLCAGFSGEEILRLLSHLPTDFIRLKSGVSRINIKIGASGQETELNGLGPKIDGHSLQALVEKAAALGDCDCLVLSGSAPPSDGADPYDSILRRVRARVVLDTADLLPYLKYRPFLVKPNHLELSHMLGMPADTPEKAARGGRSLLQMGAQNVLVSMGASGALLLFDGQEHFLPAPAGQALSPCGAGDSMVAGFLYGLYCGCGPKASLAWAVAAGSATAFSAGIAPGSRVRDIHSRIS